MLPCEHHCYKTNFTSTHTNISLPCKESERKPLRPTNYGKKRLSHSFSLQLSLRTVVSIFIPKQQKMTHFDPSFFVLGFSMVLILSRPRCLSAIFILRYFIAAFLTRLNFSVFWRVLLGYCTIVVLVPVPVLVAVPYLRYSHSTQKVPVCLFFSLTRTTSKQKKKTIIHFIYFSLSPSGPSQAQKIETDSTRISKGKR